MSTEGWEEILMDVEVADLVRSALRETFAGISEEDSELDLELVDMAVERWVSAKICEDLPFQRQNSARTTW